MTHPGAAGGPAGAGLRLGLGVALAVAMGAATLGAATRYDPGLRFRVLKTPHFVIYFHQGEDHLARRLAEVAETTRTRLAERFGLTAPARTHVILVDQTDIANGWATPIPYDTIQVTAIPPLPESWLGNADDWLELVFTHEYTHILHLDRTQGWMRAVRAVLGRSPAAFPNLYLPAWQVEGLPTYAESVVTLRGRLGAGDFVNVLDQAAAHGRFPPVDRVGGGLVAWPGGNAPYLYGGLFHEYLADRYGEARLGDLARRTAGRVPFLGGPAFRQTFGVPATTAWQDFAHDRTRRALAAPPDRVPVTRLTHHGFTVEAPRFAPANAGDDQRREVWYGASGPDGFPGLYHLDLASGQSRRVADRYLGDGLHVRQRWVYFDQLELVHNVSLLGDLYAFDRETGRTWRLTTAARISAPDVSPDGSRLAVVVAGPGGRAIAIFRMGRPNDEGTPPGPQGSPIVTVAVADGQYAAPRWSPDGSRVAAERRLGDGTSEIVVIDAETGRTRAVVSSRHDRCVTPAWTPDGTTIVFAWARGREPFQLYRVPASPQGAMAADPLPVLHTSHGATSPDVSSDGRKVLFVGMTDDGYDLFSAPLSDVASRPDEARPEPPGQPAPASTSVAPVEDPDEAGTPYTPWATLAPRAWMPVAQADGQRWQLGASVSGGDVLGRHAYDARVLWPLTGYPNLGASRPRRGPDWSLDYAYDRWWPTIFATLADTTTPLLDQVLTPGGAPEDFEQRERSAAAGVYLPVRRIRYLVGALASIDVVENTLRSSTRTGTTMRNALRFGLAASTARFYGYSISPEGGLTGVATFEAVSPALGADGRAQAATGDLRLYVNARPSHAVLAIRGAGGTSVGDLGVRRLLSLGGSAAPAPGFDFGRRALGLLRGFPPDAFVGTSLGVVNVDYRVPLWRVERGIRTWPVFLDVLHGGLFVDAGSTWVGSGSRGPVRTSAGAELSADLTLGYWYPLTIAAGVAWTRDPSGERPSGAAGFVRLGRAF